MIRRTRTRRAMGAALIATAVVLAGPATTAGGIEEVPRRVCAYDWREGTWHVKQLIKCAARRWDSPGVPDKAITVARCESNLQPKAYNPNGYAGTVPAGDRVLARPRGPVGPARPLRVQRPGEHHRLDQDGRLAEIVERLGRVRVTGALSERDRRGGAGP